MAIGHKNINQTIIRKDIRDDPFLSLASLVSSLVSSNLCHQFTKGGFFSESAIHFSDLQISKKNIFQKTILFLKFKFSVNNTLLLWAGNLNFKLRIVFWNILFLRFGDLKKFHHTF